MRIRGHVQGVFFRAGVKREAERLGLFGFARNESDGSVTIEVQGEESAVKEFLGWAKKGSKSAKVEKVEMEETDPIEEEGFETR